MKGFTVDKMKTLDEVIKAFEHCTDPNSDPDYDACAECPYCDDAKGCYSHKTDALHYLKVFRDAKDALDTERDRYAEAVKNCERAEAKYTKKVFDMIQNPPLTWDELREMVGKPVWVVEEGYQTWEYWSLVYWMKDDELTLFNENGQTTYLKNEQGTVWQAYRKERE